MHGTEYGHARHGRGSIFCNPTQHNIEQQRNVVQIGYINQKPISK